MSLPIVAEGNLKVEETLQAAPCYAMLEAACTFQHMCQFEWVE